MNKNEFYDSLSESTIEVAKCSEMAKKYDNAKLMNAGLAGLTFLGGVASFADGDSAMGNALIGASIIKISEAWADYAISADYEMRAQTEEIKKLCKITSQILNDSSIDENNSSDEQTSIEADVALDKDDFYNEYIDG